MFFQVIHFRLMSSFPLGFIGTMQKRIFSFRQFWLPLLTSSTVIVSPALALPTLAESNIPTSHSLANSQLIADRNDVERRVYNLS